MGRIESISTSEFFITLFVVGEKLKFLDDEASFLGQLPKESREEDSII